MRPSSILEVQVVVAGDRAGVADVADDVAAFDTRALAATEVVGAEMEELVLRPGVARQRPAVAGTRRAGARVALRQHTRLDGEHHVPSGQHDVGAFVASGPDGVAAAVAAGPQRAVARRIRRKDELAGRRIGEVPTNAKRTHRGLDRQRGSPVLRTLRRGPIGVALDADRHTDDRERDRHQRDQPGHRARRPARGNSRSRRWVGHGVRGTASGRCIGTNPPALERL